MKLSSDFVDAPVRRWFAGLAVVCSVGVLGGCSTALPGLPESTDSASSAAPGAGSRLPAQPAPAAAVDGGDGAVAGRTAQLGVSDASAAAAVGLRSATEAIAILGEREVAFVTAADFGATNRSESAEEVIPVRVTPIPEGDCRSIATSFTGVAVACGDRLIELAADGTTVRQVQAKEQVSAGTFDSEGRAVLSHVGGDKLYFFDAEGNEAGSEFDTKGLDTALLVRQDHGGDRPAMISRSQTSITDVSLEDAARNAALRIGQGVGQAAASGTGNGVIVATDTVQGQLMVYTMNDLIRLHQAAPAGTSPYAVAWDGVRNLAWVSTTADSQLRAYDISTGAIVQVAELGALADVRQLFALANGDVIAWAEDGEVMIVPAVDVDAAVVPVADAAKRFPANVVATTQ